nr:unnamed protein product [Callosobruchus chinensis]
MALPEGNPLIPRFIKTAQCLAAQNSGGVWCSTGISTRSHIIKFNVYINDVLSILDEEGAVFCFADDTVIIVQGESWKIAIKKSEIAFSKIMCWLSLNIEKKFLTFAHSSRTLPTIQILRIHKVKCDGLESSACGDKIERVESIKYLGVFLDQKLNWKDHIYYVGKKIGEALVKPPYRHSKLPKNM